MGETKRHSLVGKKETIWITQAIKRRLLSVYVWFVGVYLSTFFFFLLGNSASEKFFLRFIESNSQRYFEYRRQQVQVLSAQAWDL
jgi:hypothetical protein